MLNRISPIRRISWLVTMVAVFVVLGLSDMADARSKSGGRSFGGSGSGFGSGSSKSFGSPSGSKPFSPASPMGGGGGSSFLRGLGGGLVGGMIGSMLFGGIGHAGGVGGVGGSGIGLFELLILGGLGFFLFKRFIKPKMSRNPGSSPFQPFSTAGFPSSGFQTPPPAPTPSMTGRSLDDGYHLIKQSEPDFDPNKFKEIAQDVFFKVQAAWMRRDTSPVQGLLGQQLKTEYDAHFADMKRQGLINRLENIAVRNIEITEIGMEGRDIYITILFSANLLDYTVEESSGKVVKGDNTEPVKFEEFWTFARPADSTQWKLEGIDVKQP